MPMSQRASHARKCAGLLGLKGGTSERSRAGRTRMGKTLVGLSSKAIFMLAPVVLVIVITRNATGASAAIIGKAFLRL